MSYGTQYQSAVKAITSTAAIILLSACAANGPSLLEQPTSNAMEPMDYPDFSVGFRKSFRDDLTGKMRFWDVTKMNDKGGIDVTMDNGCEWDNSDLWFDGSGNWKDCGSGSWSSGTGKLLESSGSLWPLAIGKTATYRFTQTNRDGEVAKHKRQCVVGTANIETGKGAIDTYKVRCTEGSGSNKQVRTWYFNPEYAEVRFMRWKADGNGIRVNHNYLPEI